MSFKWMLEGGLCETSFGSANRRWKLLNLYASKNRARRTCLDTYFAHESLVQVRAVSNNSSLVRAYDEADTSVVQHDFMHLSFFQDDFKELVDTLVVALRLIEKAESPIGHIHAVAVREGDLSDEGRCDFGLGFPVREDVALGESDLVELSTPPVLTQELTSLKPPMRHHGRRSHAIRLTATPHHRRARPRGPSPCPDKKSARPVTGAFSSMRGA
jgi:hypothetical protein